MSTSIQKIEIPAIVIDTDHWKNMSAEALRLAGGISITDDDENEMALNSVKQIKLVGKKIEEGRTGYTVPLNEVTKSVNGIFKPILADIEAAEKMIKSKMLAFETVKEEARRIEQKRLDDLYAQEQADALKRAQETGTEPIIVQPKPILVEERSVRTESAGASFGTTWKAEVVSFMDLVKAVADGKAPAECLMVDMSFLNKQAKSYKRDGVITGVKFSPEKTVSVR